MQDSETEQIRTLIEHYILFMYIMMYTTTSGFVFEGRYTFQSCHNLKTGESKDKSNTKHLRPDSVRFSRRLGPLGTT